MSDPRLVAALRTARSTWGDAPSAPPPSSPRVERAVEHLRVALFPEIEGPGPDETHCDLDARVAAALDRALELLRPEAARALVHQGFTGDAAAEASARLERFAAALPRIRTLLDGDVDAAFAGDPAAKSRIEVQLCYPTFTALLHHRIAHALYGEGLTLLARFVSERAHGATGIDIHPGARIGARCFIDHGTGVVIGETAALGDDVRLYQGVTLGAKSFPTDESGAAVKDLPRHPVLGDGVVVYAGATVLGRVEIGSGSVIGGNVWLTRSVPSQSRVTQQRSRQESFEGGAGI